MIRFAVLTSLVVLSCARPEAEVPTVVAVQKAPLVTAFAAGSLIVPMDTTSQDSGTLRAFGLVDQLLRANVPVHRVALTGKTVGATDFSATVTQRETGAALGTVSYRGGPFLVAQADITPAVLTLVDAYLASDTVTNVHRATAAFSADVRRTLVAAPRIAVLRDGNESIAYNYLNAANIRDSNGNAWTATSPGAITLAAAAGANGGAFDGALFTGGQPAFDQLTSMHYNSPANDEVVREVRGWLALGPTTHAYMQCHAIESFETNINGKFLSSGGMADDGATANPPRILVPDDLFAQYDGTFTVDNGSVDSIGLLPGSVLYANSSLLIDRSGSAFGTRMVWLTGHLDGNTNNGKVSYLAGHNYSTALPISTNAGTNGTRLFLNGLYETPGLFASDQPVVAITAAAPATTSAATFVFTLNYANAGPGAVFSATLRDVVPAGTTFVSATGGGVFSAGTVTWNLGTLAKNASGSVTVTVSAPEGTYVNQATLAYVLGATNKSITSNSTSTVVDRTAPDTTLTATPPVVSAVNSATFTFTATEPAATFECSLDSGPFVVCTTPRNLTGLTDGSHTFQVRAIDAAGNLDLTPASFTWTVDTTPPDTALTTTPAAITNSTSATFTFTATEPGTFQCSLDGALFTACTTPRTLTGLSQGSHTFQVRAMDTAGNLDASPASFTWTIDTTPPDTTLTGTPPALSASTSASFSFTATEAGTFQCSLDGGAFVACTTPLSLTGLSQGSHTFLVRAIDLAGNLDATPASFTWTVDTVAPDTAFTSTPPSISNSTSATFTFTATEPGTFVCSLDGAAFTGCTTPLSLTGLAQGSHTLQVSAVDLAGNVDASPASFTWTVDTLPPDTTLTSTPPSVSNSTAATFTFTGTEPGTFECALDAGAFAACTSPRTLTGLSQGSHTFQARARDLAGNLDPTPASFTWTVDTVAPDTTLTSTPPAVTNATTGTFTFTATEPGTFECSIDGGAFAVCTSPRSLTGLTEGSHTFQVRARDTAGNVDLTPASYTWTVDTTAPDTVLTSTPPAVSSSNAASFTFTSTEAGTFECSLDGAAFTACTTPRALTGLSEGNHTFQVRAVDSAGNLDATPASHTWVVDTLPPDTTLTSTPPAVTNATSATFTFTGTEPGTFECSLDGALFTACTTPRALTGLSPGSHTFRVRAVDGAGNVDPSPASFTWTVDTTPPDTTITSGPAALTNSAVASFTFTATEPGSTFECSLDSGGFAACSSPRTESGLAEGSHTLLVRAIDPAGNVDPTPASRTWVVDLTPPDTVITAAPPSLSNSSSATFAFSATEFGSTFECSLDAAPFTACSSPLSLINQTDGSHTFAVRATDAAGNLDSTPASHTWTVDTTAPDTTLISGPNGAVSNTTATFLAASEPGATFECSLDGAPFAPCNAMSSYPNLAEGPHTFAVRALDAAGNFDPTPATRAWTVDTVAPDTSITAGPSGAVASQDATFSFGSTESPVTFECNLDGTGFVPCAASSTFSGLGDGAHTLQVRATDAAGNLDATPASRTWQVDTRPPDTTLTAAPSGITNESTATLTFTSDEAGATFECSLDNAVFAACSSPRVLTALNDGPHTFAVRAIDAAGNVDPTPAIASWTVDALVPDTSITSGPSGAQPTADATFTFTSTKPNSTFECSLDGATFTTCSTPLSFTGLAQGAHTLQVRARDLAGNLDPTPATASWTVDTQAPDTTLTVQPPALSNSSSARFEFTSPEAGVTFQCSLDGVAWIVCSAPLLLSGLVDGQHVLLVRAIDAAGNLDPTPARAVFEVDTTPPPAPTITEPVAGATTGAGPRFGGLAEPGSTVTVTVDGMTACTALAAANGSWSCTTTTSLTDGPHTATATATDPAGNVSMPSLPRGFTVSDAPPNTLITSGPPALTNQATARFTFTADLAGATFECSLDNSAFAPCTSPHNLSGLTDGLHRLEVRATANGVTDATPAFREWTVDTTAPGAPVLTSPAANAVTTATPVFTGTAEAGSRVVVSVDGQPACTTTTTAAGTFSCSAPSALPAGAHTATAVASDAAGNASLPSTPVPFTVDNAVLDTAITAGPSGTVRTTSANFAFTSTLVGATFECNLDGAGFLPCTTPTTFSGLAEGSHTLEVRAVDGANVDSTPASRTWLIDSMAPGRPTVTAPADQALVRTRTPRYAGTAEPGSTVRVSVDDTLACTAVADSAGAWSCTGSAALADGAHRVAAVAVDAAGNTSEPSLGNTFTIDIPLVTVTITTPVDGSLTNDNTPTLTGTATPGATVTVSIDGMVVGTALAGPSGTWSLTPTTPLTDGSHAVSATAELDGLRSPTAAMVTVRIDTRPPKVTVTLTQDNTETPPTVIFTADESPVTYTCSLDGGEFKPCTSPFDTTAAGDGNHTLIVRATDAAGNTGETTVTWVVTAPIVARPPLGIQGGGCGCGSTDGRSALWLLSLGLLFIASRRRAALEVR